MATVGIDGSSIQADSQPKSTGLVATWHLICIHRTLNGLVMTTSL